MLYTTLCLYAIFCPSVLIARGVWAVGVVEALCSVSMSPIASLVDSAIRHEFGTEGFGIQRLWGAVGFGVASLISGYLCDTNGGSYEHVMLFFVAVMAVALKASTGVPVGPTDGLQDDKEARPRVRLDEVEGSSVTQETQPVESKRADDDDASNPIVVFASGAAPDYICGGVEVQNEMVTSEPRNLLEDEPLKVSKSEPYEGGKISVLNVACIMLGTPYKASFFIAVGLSGMGAGVIDTFLFIRLKELGGSHVLCGLARLIMCLAEVPFFYLSGPLIERMGVRGVIAVAQVAYLTRFIYYSVLRDPWCVLPVEVLHGLTFAAMWSATTDYAHQITPAHMRTTMQGLVTGLHWGLGFGLGAVLGGVLYAGLGARMCFGVSAVLPSLSLLLLALPAAWPWVSNSVVQCGLWATAFRQWTWGNGCAYESVAEANGSKCTDHCGRYSQIRNGEAHSCGNGRCSRKQPVDAWEQSDSAPINNGAEADAFQTLGSKYTGGVTDKP
eukprot:jgi/Undpi1/9519/HiC_scaffold_27.g11975.m1